MWEANILNSYQSVITKAEVRLQTSPFVICRGQNVTEIGLSPPPPAEYLGFPVSALYSYRIHIRPTLYILAVHSDR